MTKQSSLKPILLHVCTILTPKYYMKNVVILKHTPPSTSLSGKASPAKYLCLLLEKQKDYSPIIAYEEGTDYETLKAGALKPKEEKKSIFNKGNLKSEGFESGYHFTYIEIGIKDVVQYYSNEIKLDQMLHLNQNLLPSK